MRLDLFDFIDRCMEEYDLRKASFEYAEKVIYEHFKGLVKEDNADIVPGEEQGEPARKTAAQQILSQL